MNFRYLVIPLTAAFWATTISAQVAKWESENSAAMEAFQERRYAEAERLLKDAFQQVAEFGELDARFSMVINNLAAVEHAEGHYADGGQLYERALSISEKLHGPEHPEVATLLDKLATDLGEGANYSEAERLYQRALAIREKALGPEDPDVAVILSELAGIMRAEAKYADAEARTCYQSKSLRSRPSGGGFGSQQHRERLSLARQV
jgi:tetratricopeptide (TPR) repeat protein